MMIRAMMRGVGTLVLLATAGAAASATPSALKEAPCRIGQSKSAAICGTFTVYENRAAHAGRTIALRFIVIKAAHPSHQAITFNPGGPGVSATASAADFADATTGSYFALRDRYDMLLVDNRGTGDSAPQQCNFVPAAHPELYFRQAWPDSLVRSCRIRLAAHANLSLYSTGAAADDLDDLRAALGYPKLVLYGGSYGTMFYLAYARQHPDRVESIVLEGVAPPHFYIIPLPMARGAQTAIDGLEAACRSDRTCSSHFPRFAQHFAALARRFDSGPVAMTVQNTVTHKPQRVELSQEQFAETLRHAMYFPGQAAYIPVTVERAYHGNYTALAELVDQMAQFFANIQANGLNLSVSCAEDIPFITERDVAQSSTGTFEAAARVRAQQRACRLWNVAPVSAAFQQPVRSSAPILMISGSDDPATPPQYGRQALRYLPNARQMIVPGASHDSDFPPCVDAIIVAFVRARSAAGLNLNRCAAKYQRPSFETLAFDEAAPAEDPALGERFRGIIASVMQGRIDRAQLTPALSKEFSNAVVEQVAADMKSAGPLQAIVYKGSSVSPKGRTYRYLLRFAQVNATASFALDKSGRVQLLDIST
jgi:pimeloyl-ACP methyl ester carboxylesterase